MKYRTEKVDDSTYIVTEKIGGVHCYLLVGSERTLLIDTGNGAGNLNALVKSLTDKPVTVVNTHGHLDHTGGNYQFECAHLAQEQEVVALHNDKAYIRASFKKMLPWYLRAAVRLIAPYLLKPHDFNAVYDLYDGMRIDLGARTIEVAVTGGHSTESVCFYERARNYLFVGDTVVNNTVLLNLKYCANLETYLRSLEKLRAFTDSETKLFSGHSTQIGVEFLERFIACAKKAESGAAEFVNGAESGADCVYAVSDGVRIALAKSEESN